MAGKARQAILLTGLLVVLAAVVAWQFRPASQVPGASTPTARVPNPRVGGSTISGDIPPPHVRLSELKKEEPEAGPGRRNPFTLRPESSQPAPPSDSAPGTPVSSSPAPTPTGPPPPPPISLKFIGTLSGAPPTGRIAVLSDGKFVYYGREGDIIEGRYRLVKIGEESLHIEYLDGRGGQTLRMSGS